MSLVGEVTSSTTAVHYVSMSDLRVLSTEKHCPVRRQHTVYTNMSLQCKGEVRSSPTEQVGRLRYVRAVDGGLEAFPLSIVICAPVPYTVLQSVY